MISRRKIWLPAILLILIFSRFLIFRDELIELPKVFHCIPFLKKEPVIWSDITREDLIQLGEQSGKLTGVPPEFLIAIFSQESALGRNVGRCYLLNPDFFGPNIGINLQNWTLTEKIMKPSRDMLPFLITMDETGRNPYTSPISCPMKIGWGGAMGPAQIIPSTWFLLKERTAQALEKEKVDPWIPLDAFTAAAIHLKDLGADHGTFQAERNAACRYFSGRSCGKKKSAISKYGDSVMRKKLYFQNLLYPEKANVLPPAKEHKKHGLKKKKHHRKSK